MIMGRRQHTLPLMNRRPHEAGPDPEGRLCPVTCAGTGSAYHISLMRLLCHFTAALFAAALPLSGAPAFTEQPIFVSGNKEVTGYDTFRIPAIVRTNSGALLAFCEGRKNSGDDAGDIDIVLRRSTDNGETWSPQTLVQEEGGTDLITIGNPAPVVDETTGNIHLLFCRNNDRVFHTVSTDDGVSWSARTEITASVKPATWTWYATGPVHGDQLKRGAQAGRLVVPCDHSATVGGFGAHVIYSDDHGATWQLGGVAAATDTVSPNETTSVELVAPAPAPGGGSRLHLNTRDSYNTPHARATTGSDDGGTSFSPATFTDAPQFLCPKVQGALVRFRATDQGDAANRILFSCPHSVARNRISIWSSSDETATWSLPKPVYEGPSAYGDMAVTADGRVALLYEKGVTSPYETITLARFNEEWLDAPPPPRVDTPGAAFWTLEETEPGQNCPTATGAIRDVHPDEHGLHMTAELGFPAVAGSPAFGDGRAISFSGNGGLRILDADSGNRFDFEPADSFTLEVVFRVPAGSTKIGALVAKDLGSKSPSWWLRADNGLVRFLVSDDYTELGFSSTATINDGQWHHIAAVRDATDPLSKQLRLYVDGQPSGTLRDTTTGTFANSNAVWIGSFNGGLRRFTGDIDLVRITPAALAPSQFVGTDTQADADADAIPDSFERAATGSLATVGPGDADGDLVPDLLEFALGADPAAAADPVHVSVLPAQDHIEISTRQRALPPWLAIELHDSDNLVDWNPTASTVTVAPLAGDLFQRTDRIDFTPPAPNRRFFRYELHKMQ